MTWADGLLLIIGLPVLGAAFYLGVLTLLSGRVAAPAPGANARATRVTFVVPAHDEAAGIAATINSLAAVDWPAEALRILVLADNCSDDTAARARAAGARVIERDDPAHRGKGYALALAFTTLINEGWSEAVIVVDADSVVSTNIVSAVVAHLARPGHWGAVQVFYGVRNPLASWRTQLMTIALAIFHRLRGRARTRLGVSTKLNGNGMGFAVAALRAVPYQAFSIAEDLEYGIALVRAGIGIAYADEASISAEMVSQADRAVSQRDRWDGGRATLRRTYAVPLVKEAVRARTLERFDLAMEVLVPPLSAVVALLGLWSVAVAVVAFWVAVPLWALSLGALAWTCLLMHVMRGVVLSGLGPVGWRALAFAPFYVAWALLLRLRRRGTRTAWVRTGRE